MSNSSEEGDVRDGVKTRDYGGGVYAPRVHLCARERVRARVHVKNITETIIS